jgi:dCTP deaminase
VFASQHLRWAVDSGVVDAGEFKIPAANIQPASMDLRLGEVAYRIRCSFLPEKRPVADKLDELLVDEVDIRREGAVLETNRPYLIPLLESLDLPEGVQGRTNPKSSTGRLDVFTRVITDYGYRFDEIAAGYTGPLYLEVVPLSFTVKVCHKLALNQLRLENGRARLSDDEVRQVHRHQGLLYRGGEHLPEDKLATGGGLFLGLDLGEPEGRVGYRAKEHAPLLEMAQVAAFEADDYWEPVYREEGHGVVLAPERFYLLLSEDSVRIPPDLAAEMTAFDPTSGELRTHYAGFFDPGFGYDPRDRFFGSRAALEVRAHDVPFLVEHGQRLCKLTFERMVATPDVLYGSDLGSSYQRQAETLSKHFRPSVAGSADR